MTELVIRNCTQAVTCDAKWENLEETKNLGIRFCQNCQKNVHLCSSDNALVEAVRLNQCVAINPNDSSSELDLMIGLWTPTNLIKK